MTQDEQGRIYAWLGFWRDKMPPRAVEELQALLGPMMAADQPEPCFCECHGSPDGPCRKVPECGLCNPLTEDQKMEADLLGYGQGFMRVSADGTKTHLPLRDLAADQPDAGPQAPIIRVSVDEFGSARVVKHYAPGLPFGEHDLYCEPEATAPMLRDHRRRGFMDATGRFVPEPPAAPPPPEAPRYAECVCMICGGYSDQAVSIATDPTNEVPE